MYTPSETDKRLLQTIVMLTNTNNGRPPTLTEIALALGYQSSSRANVQRHLARLRPAYVDWDSSPRSLQVTPAGYALLDTEASPLQGNVELPVSDLLLPLLASGLTHLTSIIDSGRPLQAPYPLAWQRGLNILAAECLLRDIDTPTHSEDAIVWCHRPLKTWPVRFRAPARVLEEALLYDNKPTELCREYAISHGDAEREACQKKMLEVLCEAQRHRAPNAYVAFRQYLITNPVVSHEALMEKSFDPSISPLGGLLMELYERVPTVTAEKGKVLLCGFCGWTLQRIRGQLCCGDERCRLLTGDFIRVATKERPESVEQLQRVRHPIRRYVVAPGIYEVHTMQALQTLGLTVELWPGFDKYDLRIIFPSKLVWAVDIKDWRFPHLLSAHLTPLSYGGNWTWDHAFYVIPDERLQELPNYLDTLRHAIANTAPSQSFTVLTINQLLQEVQKQLTEELTTHKESLHA